MRGRLEILLMLDKIEKLRSWCSEINFADPYLSSEEEDFRRQFNQAILALCKSLPPSTQTDAILFFTQYLATPVGCELNFFKNYYAPAWSILYWLIRSHPADSLPDPEDTKRAITAHAMALLLHPLDDHLNDGQLTASHLTVLLRSQAWMIMNKALNQLTRAVEDGEKIVRGFVDNYYSSVGRSEGIRTLDDYCDLFRKQMATWFIVPVLMTQKMAAAKSFTRAVQTAYGSFGIAWRLLDDLQDIETDMRSGNHSAVYICLPEHLQAMWDQGEPGTGNGHVETILDSIREHRIVDTVSGRLCRELESAAAIADGCEMENLAIELRCLAGPLENKRILDW